MRLIHWQGGTIEFRDDVVIPKKGRTGRRGPPGRYSFPFAAMAIGESFTIQPDAWDGPSGYDPEYCANRLSKAASAYRARRWRKGFNVNFETAQIAQGNMTVAIAKRIEPTPRSDAVAALNWGPLGSKARD